MAAGQEVLFLGQVHALRLVDALGPFAHPQLFDAKNLSPKLDSSATALPTRGEKH